MVVTIRVSPDTYELLKELKERRKARSFNRLLRALAEKELREKKERVVVGEEAPAEENQAEKKEEDPTLEKCPNCGFRLQGNRVQAEILNVHLPVPRIGMEIIYPACPNCMLPLTQKLGWKKTEKFKIPTI